MLEVSAVILVQTSPGTYHRSDEDILVNDGDGQAVLRKRASTVDRTILGMDGTGDDLPEHDTSWMTPADPYSNAITERPMGRQQATLGVNELIEQARDAERGMQSKNVPYKHVYPSSDRWAGAPSSAQAVSGYLPRASHAAC